MSNDENPNAVRERIAAELAALGEDPLAEDELSFARADGALDHDLDVSTVEMLAGLSSADAYDAEFAELSGRRVWQRVDAHLSSQDASPQEVTAPAQPRRLWPVALVAVAVAAGVLLVPVLRPQPTASEGSLDGDLQALGDAARLGLEALPGASGTEHADAVVASYAKRLKANNTSSPGQPRGQSRGQARGQG